jgi:hypothetical protein
MEIPGREKSGCAVRPSRPEGHFFAAELPFAIAAGVQF